MIDTPKFNFSINDASVVVTLSETLSVGHTARILDMAPNTVTVILLRIEKKLGMELFVRESNRGVTDLTKSGRAIVPYFKSIIDSANMIKQRGWIEEGEYKTGEIVFSCPPGITEYMLGPYIKNFMQKHPKIALVMRDSNDSYAKYNMASPETNEIAIVFHAGNSPDCISLPYHTFSQTFWASEEYLAENGTPKSREELAEHKLIIRDVRVEEDSQYLYNSRTPSGEVRTYIVPSNRIVDVLCTNGCGIMIASRELMALSQFPLKNILSHIPGDTIPTYVRIKREFLNTPLAQYFINWLFECRDKSFQSIGIVPSEPYKPFEVS